LDDETRDAMVALLLALRWEYLGAGASPLRHWDQLQDRVRAAARMACDVPTWVTAVSRGLQLGAPSPERAAATERVAQAVGERAAAWLDAIEAEHGYLMALARLRVQERSVEAKAAREAKAAKRDAKKTAATETAADEPSLF